MKLETLPQPVIFAHRGASAHAPENTLAAFELALAQGADAIELDAKLTADGLFLFDHVLHAGYDQFVVPFLTRIGCSGS